MIRVWFNHWFSTSYGLIELMRQDKELDVYIIASNKQYHSVIQKVCDEWYQDSSAEGEDYVRDCLEFCKEHDIHVFVPRREMVLISKYRNRFEEIGVKVLVDDYETIQFLNNKASTYDFFKTIEEIHIPEYAIVNTAKQFEEVYKQLRKKYEQICVKFVKDEGAMSYRRIVETVNPIARIREYPGANVEYDSYLSILSQLGEFDDLMVMPYLSGEEISVDCLKTENGLIAIPRYKGSSRHERIVFDESILSMTKIIMDNVKLECPCNIQFRVEGGIPYLLEINTRMSGGLQMSCLAMDINIPNIALNKLLGKNIKWTYGQKEKMVSYIEIPQVII